MQVTGEFVKTASTCAGEAEREAWDYMYLAAPYAIAITTSVRVLGTSVYPLITSATAVATAIKSGTRRLFTCE